jgi:O-antigen ligase
LNRLAAASQFNERMAALGIVVLAAAAVVAVLIAMPPTLAAAAALFAVCILAAYRLPVITLSALVVVGVGPTLFQMTGRLSGLAPVLLGRLSLADVITSAMLIAVLLKGCAALTKSGWRLDGLTALLATCSCTLLAWIAFSTIRNVGAFGIHTAGQFRYSYLILAVPAYAAIFLRSATGRRRFVVFLIVFSVGLTLVAVPIVGSMKGWGIGPASRFLPSSVSLGLLYGWVTLLLAGERGVLRAPRWLGRALSFPVAVMLLVDSHRSVWLTGLVLLAYFLVLGRIAAGLFVKMVVLGATVVASVLAVTTLLGLDTLSYVESRGSAIINPSGDVTSSWRLDLWASNLARWREHPWIGEGFGGYYAGNALNGVVVTTGPHSLPVQTLVSMGAIGLILIMGSILVSGLILWKALGAQRSARQDSLDALMLELGLGILISAQVYWAVYAFDYYSCLWVGIALAVAFGARGTRRLHETSTTRSSA